MFSYLKNLQEAWSKALSSRPFRYQFVITFLFFVAAGAHNFHYLRIWQERQGLQINDVILNFFPPRDFSVPLFFIEYTTMVLVFMAVLPSPDKLTKGLQVFALATLARTISIYFVPLEPPKDMISLMDPMANFFLHSKDIFVTKDLFFSGHIAALSVFVLVAPNRFTRVYAVTATILAAILILWQHIHYTMDVAFAPIATYICYRAVLYFHRETRLGQEMQQQEQW